MRIGIIADVHSNLLALEVVIEKLEMQDIHRIIHAGDVVGYNPYPNEVIDFLKSKGIESIKGNHDRATITSDTSWFNPAASEAVEWTRKRLFSEKIRYLSSLKDRMHFDMEGKRIAMIHGSPYDDDEYVYPHEAHKGMLLDADVDVLILAHTHVPFVRRFEGGMIVNPGSVGQPRDGDWRASFAILDSDTMDFKVFRVVYDVETVISKIYEEGLPPFLGDRLRIGR